MASVGSIELRECRPATPPNIAALRRRVVGVAALGDATTDQLDDVAVAVSEALTNVVPHAYAGQPAPGVMSVRAAVVDGVLEVVVGDEGAGMPAPERMAGTGFGLMIIARLQRMAGVA